MEVFPTMKAVIFTLEVFVIVQGLSDILDMILLWLHQLCYKLLYQMTSKIWKQSLFTNIF